MNKDLKIVPKNVLPGGWTWYVTKDESVMNALFCLEIRKDFTSIYFW